MTAHYERTFTSVKTMKFCPITLKESKILLFEHLKLNKMNIKMKVYAIACLLAVMLLFYLIVSTIWMIEYGRMAKRVRIYDTVPIQKSYALNAGMAAFGSLGFIIALYAAYKTLYYAHYYADSTVSESNTFLY